MATRHDRAPAALAWSEPQRNSEYPASQTNLKGPKMNQPSKTVAPFIAASKNLLAEVLTAVKSIDSEAHHGIAAAMQKGAFIELRTCMAFANAEILINLVDAGGQCINLGHFDIDSEKLSIH